MPTSRQTLYRQWLMLQSLPRAPRRITAGEIANRLASEGHRVSKRSVERDLQALVGVFPIECDDRSKPFGWSWLATAPSFSLPGMSPLQALVLKTAELHLKGLLPAGLLSELGPIFQQASQTLGTKPGHEGLAAWPRAVVVVPATQPVIPPEVDAEVLRTLHQALIDRRQVRIEYQPRASRESKRYAVHPIGLIQRGSVTYLACIVGDFTDPRLLAMHRIRGAEALATASKKHPPGTIDAARAMVSAGFTDRGPIRLVMAMDRHSAAHVEESRLSEDQRITPSDDPDWVMVRATVNDTEQLRWWLLAYADNVEIVSPKSLRKDMARVLASALGHYR